MRLDAAIRLRYKADMTQSLLPVELHARIDELMTAFAAFNAIRTVADDIDTEFERFDIAGATVMTDAARPDNDDYNRVLGLDSGALGRLDSVFAPLLHVKAKLRVDLAERDTSPAVCDALLERGLRPRESISYLVRRPAPIKLRPRGVSVNRLGHRGAETFFDLLESAEGYIAPAIRDKRRDHHPSDAFRIWIATVDGAPAGWATLFVHGNAGVLGNAFTFERYRRRGCQGALFAARLDDAERLGLDWVATDMRPGTTSHRNAERAGFRVASTHTVWRLHS